MSDALSEGVIKQSPDRCNSLFLMKLLKAKKKDREIAVKNAEVQMRKLMQNDPYISKDKLVILTGLSEYITNEIYMKLRREHIKKTV